MLIRNMKITKKYFRNWLNEQYKGERHRHFRYHQRVREYGDYLYYQDNEKFDWYFEIFKKLKNPTRLEFEDCL